MLINTQAPLAFGGSGNTLSGRPTQPAASSSKGKEKASSEESDADAKWGTGGHTLGSRSTYVPPSFQSRDLGAGALPPSRHREKQKAKKRKSPSPERDWGVDDDDVIVIDSD